MDLVTAAAAAQSLGIIISRLIFSDIVKPRHSVIEDEDDAL